MICPNCRKKDCHEFFNEPMEVKETHYTLVSVVFACIGGLMCFIATIIFFTTNASDTKTSMVRGIIAVAGLLIFVFSLVVGARPHFKQIYRIKAVCKKCGYQFLLVQADIKQLKYASAKKVDEPRKQYFDKSAATVGSENADKKSELSKNSENEENTFV